MKKEGNLNAVHRMHTMHHLHQPISKTRARRRPDRRPSKALTGQLSVATDGVRLKSELRAP